MREKERDLDLWGRHFIHACLHRRVGTYHGGEEGDAGQEDRKGSHLHGCRKKGIVLWVSCVVGCERMIS